MFDRKPFSRVHSAQYSTNKTNKERSSNTDEVKIKAVYKRCELIFMAPKHLSTMKITKAFN